MGCTVIGLGVPTVVDARTLAASFTEDSRTKDYESFFVTPKEADVMVRVTAKLLSSAINAAIHGEAEEYAPL